MKNQLKFPTVICVFVDVSLYVILTYDNNYYPKEQVNMGLGGAGGHGQSHFTPQNIVG